MKWHLMWICEVGDRLLGNGTIFFHLTIMMITTAMVDDCDYADVGDDGDIDDDDCHGDICQSLLGMWDSGFGIWWG